VAGKIKAAEAQRIFAAMESQAVAAASVTGGAFSLSVGAAGGLRVTGKGIPFPLGCTQYAEGWETILSHTAEISAAIEAGKDYLSRKTDDPVAQARKANHPVRRAAAERAKQSAAKRAA
jgi:hypothetical protein